MGMTRVGAGESESEKCTKIIKHIKIKMCTTDIVSKSQQQVILSPKEEEERRKERNQLRIHINAAMCFSFLLAPKKLQLHEGEPPNGMNLYILPLVLYYIQHFYVSGKKWRQRAM